MTDDEIIQALKEILELMIYEGDLQRSSTISEALNLIKRQQEYIKILQDSIEHGNEVCDNCQRDKDKGLKAARKNAITEFWSELKRRSTLDHRIVSTITGDNLVKEMVGDSNESV